MPALRNVLDDALALPSTDRETVALLLLESLDLSADEQRRIEGLWRVEIDRRLVDLKAGRSRLTTAGDDLDEIFAD